MNENTSDALSSWATTASITVIAAAVVLAIGNIASCGQHEEDAMTDRHRNNNDTIVKLVAAGVSPEAARCSVKDDRSAACALASKEPATFTSSIRSDQIAPALAPYEQSLLGK